MKFRAMDLFAGAGGLGLGLQWAGWDVVVANEYEPTFAESYQINHPHADVICGDIMSSEIQQKLFSYAGKIDLVAGGPPCQGFSTVGKKQESDPRNRLFWSFLKVVEVVRPSVVLFENVSGFKRMYEGRAYQALIDDLERLGFTTKHGILNAVDFGVPQSRQRTFVVGFKPPMKFEFPEATHADGASLFGLLPRLTLEDALSDLPDIKSGEACNSYHFAPKNEFQHLMRKGVAELTEHESPTHGARLTKVIGLVPPGGSILDIPLELRPKSYFNNTYARLWWDRCAPTMTRNFGTPSSSRCIHPFQNRGLTTREGARLQGFPDAYQFTGTRQKKNLQIGNAVPPLLAMALGRQILDCLEKKDQMAG
ncbi:MAG: DNA cytosine methyltransferase [Geothrix sp.]|uniref:DNA cytosine methyltransferase n=1 Tax=Geothrix sp. TaxID=1962974 RepID=UPI0018533AC2|nr:DNA cytosine methyltransferase [Geothrix sp.]NWJ42005.1 DNA cytosine methyltransferase [Geothrix sp.]WIL20024.1 MAG: DNA cytosine methyltransferase [Geothrix sp.]